MNYAEHARLHFILVWLFGPICLLISFYQRAPWIAVLADVTNTQQLLNSLLLFALYPFFFLSLKYSHTISLSIYLSIFFTSFGIEQCDVEPRVTMIDCVNTWQQASPVTQCHQGKKRKLEIEVEGDKRQRTKRTLWRSKEREQGSGCGSVGRAVASDTRDPRFKSSHRQNFIY